MFATKLMGSLLCIVVLAYQSSAAPVLSVVDGGLTSGNQVWNVLVAADPTIFALSSPNNSGSVAMEMGFEFDGVVLATSYNSSLWTENPGFNPFTGPSITNGISIHSNISGTIDGVFAPLGSDFLFTDGVPVQALTITTQGPGGTLSWGGQMIAFGSITPYVGGILAQEGRAFRGIQGSLTINPNGDPNGDPRVPEPGSLALASIAGAAGCLLARRRR